MAVDAQLGEIFDERFEVIELIGHGGMASVFKAIDVTTGRVVAVKVPFFSLESNPVFYSRFQREIEIGVRLDHPGVVKVLRVERPSRLYVAMEFVEGEPLWNRLQRERLLTIADALHIAASACDTLEYLHRQGVVHRDLKPSNIMLMPDGRTKIMDFGVASAAGLRRLTWAGSAGRLGTGQYMAPEQVRGRDGDSRIDLYGLGAVLYEMTTGHALYDEQPSEFAVMMARVTGDPTAPRVHNPAIPMSVEEIILHALARNRNDRYRSAEALKNDLTSPDRVDITGRVLRLTTPQPPTRPWVAPACIALAAVILPVLAFFLILFMLTR